MNPIEQHVVVDRPRAEVFEYLADIANHPEFSDHYLQQFRLTREDSYGRGAGARFKLPAPLNRFAWADVTFIEFEPPRRIVMAGRGGKYNRTRLLSEWIVEPGSGGTTRVTLTTETVPAILSDRLMEMLGQRGWLKRKQARALKRLRSILEDGRGRGTRATVAGGPRKPASQFRVPVGGSRP